MKNCSIMFITVCILSIIVQNVYCADETTDKYDYSKVVTPVNQQATEEKAVTTNKPSEYELMINHRTMQDRNKLYVCAVLSVVLLTSLFMVLRFITSKANYNPMHIVNASGLIFLIFGTIFLVILTDSETQLTASMGIIGAIAGYLFGTMRKSDDPSKPSETK